MRTIVVAGVSLITLAAGIAAAQAEMPANGGAATTMLRGSDPGESRSPGQSARGRSSAVTAEAVTPGETGSIAMPSHAGAASVKKAADSWCRSGRIAGTGTGFCLIN